eukprot:5265218-Pyramimonas_sp.AAC.1
MRRGPRAHRFYGRRDLPVGPASGNMFCRASLPPAPDKRQSEPPPIDPRDGDQEVIVGHAVSFKGRQLSVTTEERGQIIRRTPGPMKQKVRDAHTTGPVPPRIEAIRNQTGNTLRYIAEFAEDPVFAWLSSLSQADGTFDQAREFLRAEFHSED